ncbi:hypothetical protein ADN00_05300 [Ornatilinea apprima]|uniref:Isoprenylcysteine carboxylmethyltransferase family protein n=2 Tax=Ornatilinea apprima TaxID=1134406 RepID=A0A0P6XF94_9CHLR|nr:hypothetical protein ADN00_05300 [Ornatilinea apprima]
MVFLSIPLTIFAVAQILLAFLLYNPQANETVINAGWAILFLSAVFGWLPIFTFRAKGGVKGRGYIQTTVLVDSGIYAIVRHPQYLAGILINIALALISQHGLVALTGVAAAVLYYLGIFDEEKGCIEKFGEEYIQYMKRVPRINFILGIFRILLNRH